MRILLSNDDSVHAPGLEAVYRELKKLGKVCVVAPLDEKSTTGHSLTIHKPLRMISIREDFWGVSGSPADCVYLGIREVLKGTPDLVVSGINRGANLGQDIYYSGTVSAAREAAILGIPAMAVSLAVDFSHIPREDEIHYSSAAKLAIKVLKKIDFKKIPKHTLLNLNVPDLPLAQIKGISLAKQGFRFYSGSVLKRKDHRGRPYYWVGGRYKGFKSEQDTDCETIDRKFASLTPLKLDCTDFQTLAVLSSHWKSI